MVRLIQIEYTLIQEQTVNIMTKTFSRSENEAHHHDKITSLWMNVRLNYVISYTNILHL